MFTTNSESMLVVADAMDSSPVQAASPVNDKLEALNKRYFCPYPIVNNTMPCNKLYTNYLLSIYAMTFVLVI